MTVDDAATGAPRPADDPPTHDPPTHVPPTDDASYDPGEPLDPPDPEDGAWAPRPAPREPWHDPGTLRLAAAGIAAVQATVLSLLAVRGSWYTDDLDFLAHGARTGLTVAGLGERVNDHLAPGLRLVYATFAQLAPLDYGFTVWWRAGIQAVATFLMALLLLRLLGPRPLVLVGTVLYAATPLTMPSFMSLASGVNLLHSQVFGLLLLVATVDWSRTRRRRHLVVVALALLGGLCFWEKSVLVLGTATGLLLGPLAAESGESTRRALRRSWPYGLALAEPLLLFGGAYLAGGPPAGGARWPGTAVAGHLFGRAWLDVVGTATVAGPWRWVPSSPPYFGLAAPPPVAVAAGQALLVALVVVALARARPVLWVWAAVPMYVAGNVVILAVGRWPVFGDLVLTTYHYWADLAVPLVVAATLTLAPVVDTARTRRVPLRLRALPMVAFLVGAAVCAGGFATYWSANPAGRYLATLHEDLVARGAPTNLWDVPVPSTVLTLLTPDRRLSRVLTLTDWPAAFQQPGTDPATVDDEGHVRAALIAPHASAPAVRNGCGYAVRGRGSVDVPLDRPLGTGDWFARIGYLTDRPAQVSVALVSGTAGPGDPGWTPFDASGGTWPAGLAAAPLHLVRPAAGDRLVLTGLDDEVNVCVGDAAVGTVEAVP